MSKWNTYISFFLSLLSRKETVLMLVKPDAMRHSKSISQIFINFGFEKLAEKNIYPTLQQAKLHYSKKDKGWRDDRATERLKVSDVPFRREGELEIFGNLILEQTVRQLSSGPMTAYLFSRKDAFKKAKILRGFTDPSTSLPGTIRAEFTPHNFSTPDSIEKSAKDMRAMCSVLHCSDCKEDVLREVAIWVPEWVQKYFKTK